jgi:membrane-associated protease RseP (regulator of RpoE activity)
LVVVVDPHYTGSQTTSVPLTLPTTQTSYTNGTATAFGPGGVATAYGNATTTTYGTQTEYIPMTVHRFDYGALYFVKAKPRPLGIHVRELNDSERAALQSNKGLVVQIVMDDSPAWRADILKGDIIEALDGEPVSTMAAFGDQTQARRGRDVTVTVIRNGQTIAYSGEAGPPFRCKRGHHSGACRAGVEAVGKLWSLLMISSMPFAA